MTHSEDTVLVITDATKTVVQGGVGTVNAIHPVDQLVPIQENSLRGYGSNRTTIEYNTFAFNDLHYFTCLRIK